MHTIPHPYEPNASLPQMLWPDHCVEGTRGAEVHDHVQAALDERQETGMPVSYVLKGTDARMDCYSGFACAEYTQFTEMASILHRANIHTLVLCGLANDYCLGSTAVDAAKFGFRTYVLQDYIRGVDPSTTAKAEQVMSWYHVSLCTW